jgi:hypothetical protein
VPSSLVWVTTNIVGTVRDSVRKITFVTRFVAWDTVREKRAKVCKLIPVT